MAESTTGRGGDSDMGYYVDSFLVPLLESFCEEKNKKKMLHVSKEKLQILMPACATLPLQIYDRGFKNITIAGNDKELMMRMMREHLRDRPEMRWRTIDITMMTTPGAVSSSKTQTKIERDYFHVVIDHGALATTLTSTLDVLCYLEEVRNVLKEGGKFVCTTIFETETRDQIFQTFRCGYKMSLRRLRENEKTLLVVIQKVSSIAPFLIFSELNNIEDEDHLRAIEEENGRRTILLESKVLWIEDLREGVMGDMESIIPGRHMELYWPVSCYTYKILVFDVDVANPEYSYHAIFFREEVGTKTEADIRELPWLDNNNRLLKFVARACRLYFIFVGYDAEGRAKKKILKDLQPLLQELAPRNSNLLSRWFDWFTSRDVSELVKEKDPSSEPSSSQPPSPQDLRIYLPVEGKEKDKEVKLTVDLEPESVDLVPSSEPSSSQPPAPQDLLDLVPSSEPPSSQPPAPQDLRICLPFEGYLLSTHGTKFLIHSGHCDEKQVLNINMDDMGMFYVESINKREKSVLIEVQYDMTLTEWLKQTPERWSVTHEAWNSDDSKKKNKVDKVPHWNSSRPIDECCQVIEGLLKEVFEWHSKKRVHGYLSKSDNYGLSFRSESVFGVEKKYVDVTLLYVDTTDEVVTYEKAYETDIMNLDTLIFMTILGDKKLPRLWEDLHRLIMQLSNEVEFKAMNQVNLASARDYIKGHLAMWNWHRRWELYEMLWMKLHGSSMLSSVVSQAINSVSPENWDCIPKDTPLDRVFGTGYGLTSYDQFRYLRTLHMHYKEKNSSAECIYVNKDEVDYFDNEYVEVVSSEVFSKFQLGIFEGFKGKLQG